DEALALHAVEQRILGGAQPLHDEADLTLERVALEVADARQVELVDQLAVDEALELLEALHALAVGGVVAAHRHAGQSAQAAPTGLAGGAGIAQAIQTPLQTRHG